MKYRQVVYKNVKSLNKHAVIDLIRYAPAGIARVDLARQMGLTRAAVTTIVKDLKELGVVREAKRHPDGKRSIMLEIDPEIGYVVGIDMGATHVNMILADYAAQVLMELEKPLDIAQGPKVCLDNLYGYYQTFIKQAGLRLADISAIGLGVPGPIVFNAGMVSFPPIMPGWNGFPIRDYLQNRCSCPIYLGNDAEFGALGEWAYGAGRSEDNLAYIKVGTGIGAGLLINGQIYRGTTGSAGEIGHITIDEKGPLCSCGNYGCLEAMAGGKAIARRAREAAQMGRKTILSEFEDFDQLSARDVVMAARKGDLLAQEIIRETGVYLGTAVASLVNLFNPSMVVIGGKVAQSGDLLLEPIRRTVHARSLRGASKATRITAAFLGRRSTGMGAVVQALSMKLHEMV